MPVDHIVLFRWQPGTAPEQINHLLNAILRFDEIPGVEEVSVGANFSDRAQGYTHGIVVRLKDRESLDQLIPHPAHQKVHEMTTPILDESLVFDYEFLRQGEL